MSNFDRHIVKERELRLTTAEGVEDVFVISPLPFMRMGDLFQVLKKMTALEGMDKLENVEQAKKILDMLDKDTITLIQGLCLDAMKISYPNEKEELLKKFVSANLFELFPIVLEMNALSNMPKGKDDKGQSKEAPKQTSG